MNKTKNSTFNLKMYHFLISADLFNYLFIGDKNTGPH